MTALSRRAFAQLLGTAAAAASMPLSLAADTTSEVVRLSANENPYGPCPAALNSMREGFGVACRYPDDEVDQLVADLAKLHGVSTSQVLLGAGSGEILRLAAVAFTGPNRAAVVADPTFEAIARHAASLGADVRRVPLNKAYEHDVDAMAEAAKGAGLVYICNPNNPTATITPAPKVQKLTAADTMVLVDEAYHHYVTSDQYTSVLDVSVPRRKNVIALRTFSKVYGMAGMRCGYAIGDESVIKAMRKHQTPDSVNILVALAARAALRDQENVAVQRKRNADTRAWLVEQMRALGRDVLSSQANFVMIDTGRNVRPIITAMRERGVEVGRLFPAMPNHLRLTVGKPDEMKRFVDVFAGLTT